MYCTKCGSQVDDNSKFCINCGQPLKQELPIDTSPKSHKKTNNAVLVLTSVIIVMIIVLLLLAIIYLVRNGDEGSSARDEGASSSLRGKNTEEDMGEAYENGCLNFDVIISQCEDCETPLNTLVEFCDLGSAYGYDEDRIIECSERKYSEMQHNCTADVIQVENVPYVYRCCYGTYSGEWQGAGPTGTGTFIGEPRLTFGLVTYTGEWKYGLPEGEGELYIENFLGTWNDMKYVGQMSAGLRHGTGYLYDFIGIRNADEYDDTYRVYGETVFQNDIIAAEIDAVDYDINTGEVKHYYRFIGSEDGWVYSVAEWGPNELSPEGKQLMEYAAIAAIGYLTYLGIDYLSDAPSGFDYERSNQESLAYLEEYRAQQEADLLEQQERAAEETERIRLWNEEQYYEALSYDPDEWLITTRNYKYNAGLGY